jgi:plasmid stability protein
MAMLNLRNVPEVTHRQLRVRAAQHGRSMESEARAIIEESLRPAPAGAGAAALPAWVEALYRDRSPRGVVDELIRERRQEATQE